MPSSHVRFTPDYDEVEPTPHVLYASGRGRAPDLAKGIDGSSWGKSVTDLQWLIDHMFGTTDPDGIPYTEIWIEGTVLPESFATGITASYQSDVKNMAFVTKEGLKLYGGFDGTEYGADADAGRAKRKPNGSGGFLHESILDGGDRAYHVVILRGTGVELRDLSVTGGRARNSGGMSISGYGSVNRAYGGGLYCSSGSAELENLQIYDNAANTYGGGVYFNGSGVTVRLDRVSFTGNVSYGGGGGAYIGESAAVKLDRVSFTGNVAYSNGGGAYVNELGAGSLTVWRDIDFINNISVSDGGGLYGNVSNTDFILEGGLFEGNYSQNRAGGAYLSGGSSGSGFVILNHVEWIGNKSIYSGGGLYINGFSGLYVLNSLFAGNELIGSVGYGSNFGGGGLFSGGFCTLINTTVVNNYANSYGGGVYFGFAGGTNNSVPVIFEQYLYNSLVWGNTAEYSGNNLYGNASTLGTILGNQFIVRSSLIENAETNTYFGTALSSLITLFPGIQVNRRDYDLKFLSGLYGDANFWMAKAGTIFDGNYHLQNGSMAVNRGNDTDTLYDPDNTGELYYPDSPEGFAARYGLDLSTEALNALRPRWNKDLAGENRFRGAGAVIDIGAYEWQE
jgi:hypothetical protein